MNSQPLALFPRPVKRPQKGSRRWEVFCCFFLLPYLFQQRSGNPIHTISAGHLMVSLPVCSTSVSVLCSTRCSVLLFYFYFVVFSSLPTFGSCCHQVCAVLSVWAGEPPLATKWCLFRFLFLSFFFLCHMRKRLQIKTKTEQRTKEREKNSSPPSVLLTPRLFWLLKRCRVEPRGHSS